MKNENYETLPAHIKKFRLGVYASEYDQPISLMRCLGPLQQMAKEDPRLELVQAPLTENGRLLSWSWLNGLDGVFYLHPEQDFQCYSICLAKSLDVPVWAEYVDDIFNVDRSNPGWKERRNRDALRVNISVAVTGARVVTTVSNQNRTAILEGLDIVDDKDRLLAANKMIVLPEACLWDQQDAPRQKVVSWRGLGSHAGDIDHALPHLLDVAKRFQDWTWLFCGDWEIVQELGKQLCTVTDKEKVMMMPQFPTPFDMMDAWGRMAPFIHVVPLADTKFNRSKSHLAWLEATAIGAACIAPDHLDEWNQPGVIRYHETNLVATREDMLSEVLSKEMVRFSDGRMHANVAEARAAIYPDRTLKSMNRVRWAILRKFCAPASQ